MFPDGDGTGSQSHIPSGGAVRVSSRPFKYSLVIPLLASFEDCPKENKYFAINRYDPSGDHTGPEVSLPSGRSGCQVVIGGVTSLRMVSAPPPTGTTAHCTL